ncbi:pentatricopeptide repeat-containing protein [Striga asiatica]|uniref:Pentatricopeptide repeat-containing protein n=1 Tax=Striga asiatica TaxID=4170 RepID=A0A5A7Q3X6_STRAF|nr:pentatricopeptide repeat-containing protein [Striga asiatica]
MVKGRQGERVRLYVRGTILGYKRSKSNQYPNTSLIQIEGVNTQEEVSWYLGKRMAYIYKAKVKKNGSHYRCIWGKVTRPHGNSGVVRAKFKSNLPPKSMGDRPPPEDRIVSTPGTTGIGGNQGKAIATDLPQGCPQPPSEHDRRCSPPFLARSGAHLLERRPLQGRISNGPLLPLHRTLGEPEGCCFKSPRISNNRHVGTSKSFASAQGALWLLSFQESRIKFQNHPDFMCKARDRKILLGKSHSPYPSMKVRAFCSGTEAKSKDQEDDSEEDAFSELESPAQKGPSLEENDDESLSESDFLEGETIDDDDVANELEIIESETNATGKTKSSRKIFNSTMAEAIMASPTLRFSEAAEKWIKEGNEVTQDQISLTIGCFRKRRMFNTALQFSEWLESTGRFIPSAKNYASRLDLIAKARGVHKAEEYIQYVPDSYRGEIVFSTLLANFVSARDVNKSEDLFCKMKNLFPLTPFPCNLLLLLYQRVDKNKISRVLTIMENENVKPNHFTYHILIDTKGQLGDIPGMEQVVETMKKSSCGPNFKTQLTLARHYASNRLLDKSEAILKKIEGGNLVKNRWTVKFLLPVYGLLGKADEVRRLWRACGPESPSFNECLAAIDAFGRVGLVEEAEGAFRKLEGGMKKPSLKHFIALLKVYTNHKMVEKGKDLVERMAESKCYVGPHTWDALVRLYVESGEVERADSILEKAGGLKNKKQKKPLMGSYLAVLDVYAGRGDVANAEKIFRWMKQAGYPAAVKPYKSLLYAYINGKVPAYGFQERLKGDNVVPSNALSSLVARSDVLWKSTFAEL